PHRGMLRLALDRSILPITPEDVGVQGAPLAFDATVIEIWPLLLNGASIRVLSDEELLDPKRLTAVLAHIGATYLWLTCGLFSRVVDEAPEAFAGARLVVTGGEAMSLAHARRFLDAHPAIRLINAYGPTENSCITTTHTVIRRDLDGSIPIGRPITGTRVFIVDQRLRPAPIGAWGELVCAGDGVALGYAGRPDLTAKSFVELPWGSHERVYRTGDRARFRRDGLIEYGGRADGQVKIRGQRIEIEAIETALIACDGVRDAAVLVVGTGVERLLVAVVVADRSRESLWRHTLAETLPIHMLPAQFIVADTLPVNGNGKRDRRALIALIEAVGGARSERRATPRNAAEALVLRLFETLFPGAAIDSESDFFELGGHSLLAMRLSNLLQETTGARIALRDLFVARTVAGIAALVPATAEPTRPAAAVAEPAADAAEHRLSPGQERLWVIQRLFPDSGAYNVPLLLDIAGPLDEAALGRALVALEGRHHALRLRVVDHEAGPRQRLQPPGGLQLVVVDLSAAPDPATAVHERQMAEIVRPFRLETENGARAFLLRQGPEHCWLMMVLHHSICDGWSLATLYRDLGALYACETVGAAPLPPPLRCFEDEAAERRAFASSVEGQKLVKRWVERLSPPAEPLDLPTDRPRPPMASFRGSIIKYRFSAERSAALLRLARNEGATPFALGAALVTAFLARLTGQTDIVAGTLVSGRFRPELTDMVGFLVNTLVLRRDLGGNPTFRRHLADTRNECIRVISDQDCSFETVVDALALRRDLGRNPLFDVMIVWQDTEAAAPVFPGAVVNAVEPEFPFAKFDLSFDLGLEADRLICRLEYSSDLFDRETAETFLDRLDAVAAAVVADPDTSIDDLPIMSEAERVRVVETFNATSRPFDTRRTICRPFLDQLGANGERMAVLRDGAAPVSYRSFAGLAGRVARRLSEAGVRPGDAIALIGARSLELLAAIHGVLMAGCTYVPLGADQPDARIAAMLEDLAHPLVLAAADCRTTADRLSTRVLELSDGGSAAPADLGSPDGLAYVLFTSGSTGRPKGVAIEHHSVLNRILWMAETFPIGPGDVILQKTPVTFDVSAWELFWWSWTGAAVALPPVGTERDPQALIDFIDRHGVTVVHFVPSMLAEFLSCLESRPDMAARLSRLRFVFASGEALDPGLVDRFDRTLYRPFGVQLHNLYGPTEATVDVTWHPCSPWTGADVVPIGKPIANTSVHILDTHGRAQPIGVAGEICLGGPQVARGYVARPDLTRDRFIADPFRAGGRLYRTGDLGRFRRDGAVEYLGRIDNQVKIRGQRIEPGEIERALERHPAIERAFVVPAIVAGLAELRAFVVTRAAVTSAELRAHLRLHVTEAMIPARFLRSAEPPLTASGKTDRKALKGEPLDGAAVQPETRAAVPAQSEEEEIRAIWAILIPDADPSPRDGFFDAGGNSLLVIRLHARLDARWPGVFAVADLFALSTIAEQARRVRERIGRDVLAPVAVASPALPTPVALPIPLAAESLPVAVVRTARPARSFDGAIAIVGMAVRVAGAETTEEMWRDVIGGADRVRAFSPERIADAVALAAAAGRATPRRFREAAYLEDVAGFDPRRFRMSPADASLMDPEQRLFLDTASRALEDGGRGGTALDGARVGVFVGGPPDSIWRDAVSTAFPERLEQIFALNVPSNIATRLSFLRDWRGPAMLIDTACSSALVAVHCAVRALRAADCDWALAGAAKVIAVPPDADIRVTIDSSTSRTRAFAEGADGTGMGEGSVVFLLRRLDDALADGDPIHAVILGTATNQDGASSGLTAPNPAAQAEVIRAAAADAGVPLSTLSHIEAHGTGTALGDPIEIEGLTRAFAAETTEAGFATVGSGKGNYGHLDGAAGALGLARAVLTLVHDQAPPQPFFTRPNPHIAFDRSAVRVPSAPTALTDRGTPRRAGVSAFGLSGINAHVVIEVAPEARPIEIINGWLAVCLSAATEPELRRLAGDIVEAMRARPDLPLGAIARTLAEGREMFDARAAAWVRDRGDLMARLAVFAVAPESTGGLVLTGTAERAHADRTIVVAEATEDAARAAAAAYVAGARPVWPAELAAGRVHLPAARPARRRLFPDFPKTAPRLVMPVRPALADLIGPPALQAGELVHAIDLQSPDFWPAAEHALNGAATLVGAAFPALIAETSPGPVRLRDLRWIRPLRPADVQPATTELRFAADGRVTLSAVDASKRRIVFAEAIVDAVATPAPETVVDIASALARLGPATAAPPFDTNAGIVSVSQRWNRALKSTGNAEESLAWFSSPDDGDVVRLNPALLDAMIGTALTEPGHVPTGCADIILWGGIPADPVVHARRRSTADGIEADIRVIDPATGRIAMVLDGFRLTRLSGGTSVGKITLAVPRWDPQPATARDPGGPVVLVGDGPLADRLAAWLASAGRLAARSGDEVDAAAQRRIGASDAPAVILALGVGTETGRRAAQACRAISGSLRAPIRLLGLGSGAWAVDGSGLVVPEQALIYGAVVCAGLEEPMLASRYVDTDETTAPGDLVAELATIGDGPSAIAWRNGRRFVRRFEAANPGAAPRALPSSGCIVISGGLGGLALALAPALAQGGRVALALLSRQGEIPSG
ncbi:MAG: amino acid adenylation domain-containing protein, partial [Ancalomicrobiaceae bacterium]|nr:amino acid adenylation domain-containing protein [Ancalomicrobiaceae bacterium]